MDLGGPEEPCIKWEFHIGPCEAAVFRGKNMPGQGDDVVGSCTKMAEPFEMLFGL